MSSYEKYMDDPGIIDEPMALREIHAIRLMIYDETKDMTPEEYTRYVRDNARKAIEKYGLKVKRPDAGLLSRRSV